jgi:hypothetical protein
MIKRKCILKQKFSQLLQQNSNNEDIHQESFLFMNEVDREVN